MHTYLFDCFNACRVPREMFEHSACQLLLWDPANDKGDVTMKTCISNMSNASSYLIMQYATNLIKIEISIRKLQMFV